MREIGKRPGKERIVSEPRTSYRQQRTIALVDAFHHGLCVHAAAHALELGHHGGKAVALARHDRLEIEVRLGRLT